MNQAHSPDVLPATPVDELSIQTIRFLAVDAIEQAKSGHPGMPMGAAAMAYTLWTRFLRFNPRDPSWPDRDRFVLSAGHGCMLLYALLHLTGYDLSLEDLKQFRQLGSRTPGHSEYGLPGVEATTGPLGQGLANAVGMALAERMLAATFNTPEHVIVDHYTYVLASDGDLMEGVALEAISLAGHLRLGKLIVLYDDNRISIEGSTEIAFTEDRPARCAACGWHTQTVADGNDVAQVAAALAAARAETDRPSLIAVRTHIGFGCPAKQDRASAHGEPLGPKNVQETKEKAGWPLTPTFLAPPEVLAHCRQALDRGAARQADWEERFRRYAQAHPEKAAEFQRRQEGRLPEGWEAHLPIFSADQGPLATRVASGKALNALAQKIPELLGGSADLAPSNNTLIKQPPDFKEVEPDVQWSNGYQGRNLRFGVREHAMGAMLNGLALHRGFLPYGGTFLIFSDYMRPSIRLAALSKLHVIYIFTHDSIGVGEDGPTHQPVEQLVGLRSIPSLLVFRPADANETTAAWRLAVTHRGGPVALVLSRQGLPILDPARYPQLLAGVARGGYVLEEAAGGAPELVMLATGSEVHLAREAREMLTAEGRRVRVVSLPCWHLFQTQPAAYRDEVIPPGTPLLAVEAGSTLGWKPYVGPAMEVVGLDRFGLSAPGPVAMQELGFTAANVCRRAKKLLAGI